MPYDLIVAPSALDSLKSEPQCSWLDESALATIEKNLTELAEKPEEISRKACLPYAPVGHLYHFRHYITDWKWLVFTVLFVYGPEEGQLSVTAMTVTRVP